MEAKRLNNGASILLTSASFEDLDALFDPTDPLASEGAFRALLPDAQKLSGGERFWLVELLSLIARTEALQGRYSQAHASIKEALRILDELQADERQAAGRDTAKIRCLLESGRLHVLEKTPSQARALLSKAWALAISSGADHLAVEIAQLMAMIEPAKAQQEWIVRALEIAENSAAAKTRRRLGGLYTSLGWKLFDSRQYERSLETFQRALAHFKADGTAREVFVAQWSIGKVLRTLGRTEEALAIQQALLSELGIGGVRDGGLYQELAECLQSLKRPDEARLYFELAYREFAKDEWLTDNQPAMVKRMKELGKVK